MGAPANQQSQPRNQVYVDQDGSMYYYKPQTSDPKEAYLLSLFGKLPPKETKTYINIPTENTERFKSNYVAPQPKSLGDLFPSLGLNFSAPRVSQQTVQAPQSTLDVNSVLGLSPSQYSGLQSVGDTGYYYANNRMYEPYTVTPASSYFYMNSPFGTTYYNNYSPYGLSSTPSYSPIFGYSGGWQRGSSGGPEEGTIYSGEQAFRPVKNADVAGFIYDADAETYDPSMAYVYANSPRTAPAQTQNTMSFLSTPLQLAKQTSSYGAGRFLNNGLIPLNFGSPNDQTGSDS